MAENISKDYKYFFSSSFTKEHIFIAMSKRKMSVIGSTKIIIDINNLIAVIDSYVANLCILIIVEIQSVHTFFEENFIS